MNYLSKSACGIWIGLLCAYGAIGALENVMMGDPEPVGAWITLVVGFMLMLISLIISIRKDG